MRKLCIISNYVEISFIHRDMKVVKKSPFRRILYDLHHRIPEFTLKYKHKILDNMIFRAEDLKWRNDWKSYIWNPQTSLCWLKMSWDSWQPGTGITGWVSGSSNSQKRPRSSSDSPHVGTPLLTSAPPSSSLSPPAVPKQISSSRNCRII